MERKLELRDIAGYLPYGVFAKFYDINFISMIDFASVGCLLSGKEPMRMILRPLPDLYEPIIHNGNEEVPIVELAKITREDLEWTKAPSDNPKSKFGRAEYTFSLHDKDFYLSVKRAGSRDVAHLCNQYQLFDYLHSRFIDYRGLIDAKLAISCYELENNPYKEKL